MWFAKADVKHFKGVALRTFKNITKSMMNWKKKKKKIPSQACISKILFIDTEQLSKT